MFVLGIESSCDETAVAVVRSALEPSDRLCGHALAAQTEAHRPYGGVVPEIAARAHLDVVEDLAREALRQAGSTLSQMDGMAAVCGPGLIGGVMVGAMTGKAFAAVTEKPFIAVNHLEAHALAVRLLENVSFPYLLLLASGGHCQLVLVRGVGEYRLLGKTLDDAAGECFDKSAKILGLDYPGGPMIEKAAETGNPAAISLPKPLTGKSGCDFSFSGLKTAVRIETGKASKPLPQPFVADMAASLQAAIADIFADRSANAFEFLKHEKISPTAFVAAGGVAANGAIRARLSKLAAAYGVPFLAPPPALCTDNGAMVAWAGLERLRLGLQDGLEFRARPRWPLEELKRKAS